MSERTTETKLFRRGRLFLSIWWLVVAVGWVSAVGFLLILVGLLFPLGSWGSEKVSGLTFMAFAALISARITLVAQSWMYNFRTNFLELDERGVRLRLGRMDEVQLGWEEIKGVTRQKQGIVEVCTIQTTRSAGRPPAKSQLGWERQSRNSWHLRLRHQQQLGRVDVGTVGVIRAEGSVAARGKPVVVLAGRHLVNLSRIGVLHTRLAQDGVRGSLGDSIVDGLVGPI